MTKCHLNSFCTKNLTSTGSSLICQIIKVLSVLLRYRYPFADYPPFPLQSYSSNSLPPVGKWKPRVKISGGVTLNLVWADVGSDVCELKERRDFLTIEKLSIVYKRMISMMMSPSWTRKNPFYSDSGAWLARVLNSCWNVVPSTFRGSHHRRKIFLIRVSHISPLLK